MSLMIASVIVWLVMTPLIGALLMMCDDFGDNNFDLFNLYGIGIITQIICAVTSVVILTVCWAFGEVGSAIINGGF